MAQERLQKRKSTEPEQDEVQVSSPDTSGSELAEKTDAVLESIEDVLEDQADEELLADIDDILEENAQQFVDAFVQQGGQ